MRRGEVYRAREKVAERGDKPGFYVVVSRSFIAENDDVSTVVCAPVYSEILGLDSEVASDLRKACRAPARPAAIS